MGAGCPRDTDEVTPQLREGTTFSLLPTELIGLVLQYAQTFWPRVKPSMDYTFKTTWQVGKETHFMAIDPKSGNIFVSDVCHIPNTNQVKTLCLKILSLEGTLLKTFALENAQDSDPFVMGPAYGSVALETKNQKFVIVMGGTKARPHVHKIDLHHDQANKQVSFPLDPPINVDIKGNEEIYAVAILQEDTLALLMRQFGVIQIQLRNFSKDQKVPAGRKHKTIVTPIRWAQQGQMGLLIHDGNFIASQLGDYADHIFWRSIEGATVLNLRLTTGDCRGRIAVDASGNHVLCTQSDMKLLTKACKLWTTVDCSQCRTPSSSPSWAGGPKNVAIDGYGRLLVLDGAGGIHIFG